MQVRVDEKSGRVWSKIVGEPLGPPSGWRPCPSRLGLVRGRGDSCMNFCAAGIARRCAKRRRPPRNRPWLRR